MTHVNEQKAKANSARRAVLVGLAVGVSVTFVIMYFLIMPYVVPTSLTAENTVKNIENTPLYWVAPMDPNFRRDKPGLSPMGMDLVPVYANGASGNDSPGTISINPNVINNLGVKTALATRQHLDVTINTVGYVQYNEDTLVHVHPRVEGWIEVLNVKAAGEYVEKGEPLYALYSPELVNAQEEFIVALKRGNRNLVAAAKSRLKALQMPETAIEKLVATGAVQQTVVFTAPQTGFVDNLNIREGFYVQPGMTLMSIGALNEVWVDAEIFERQSNLLRLNLPVLMSLAYLPGKTWEGKVDYIYPTLDANTRTLRARVRFENEGYFLKPNMFAQVSIFTQLPSSNMQADAVANIVVPSESVIRTGTQNRVVLALGEGKFKSVAVTIGHVVEVTAAQLSANNTLQAGSYTEILTGLEEGDSVVISAQFLLDSESSIHSDFIRIGGAQDTPASTSEMAGMAEMSEPVWVNATINELMIQDRIVRLSHEDIDEWGMPGMTMNFELAPNLDTALLQVGKSVQVQLQKPASGMFQIVGVKP